MSLDKAIEFIGEVEHVLGRAPLCSPATFTPSQVEDMLTNLSNAIDEIEEEVSQSDLQAMEESR